MRWEDERYVRLYTRNTPEWSSLSWRARGLFGLIMREVDRAGILELGKLGAKGVAVAVRAPWVEVEAPLSELLDDGCVRVDLVRQCLFMPNFMEAQECAQSDVARKRASREKARAVFGVTSDSAAELARSVTNRDHMTSQNVTESHVESRAVTNGHVRSLLTKPTLPEPNQEKTGEARPASSNGSPAKPRAKRLAKHARSPIEDSWAPSEAALDELVRDERVPRDVSLACVKEFVRHWLGTGGVKADWDLTFINNVVKKRDNGWLPKGPEPRVEPPSETRLIVPKDALPPDEQRAKVASLLGALSESNGAKAFGNDRR